MQNLRSAVQAHLLTLLCIFLIGQLFAGAPAKNKVQKILNTIPGVSMVEMTQDSPETYSFFFEQHIDPFDVTSPRFLQHVFLRHRDFEQPTVVVLEGYDSDGTYPNELAELLQANLLTIEHRYFGTSMPNGSIDWKTLTIRNAAEDQHRIIQAIRKALYPENAWISTGISKGGQTTLIHRSFYPEDVDGSVCYVAPLNFEREDPRIHAFLESVGTAEQREKIRTFQMLCLERKNELVKELEKKMKEKQWSWAFPTEVAFDYYVLEYSFAFWQWASDAFDRIPTEDVSNTALLDHLLRVSGVSFFEESGVESLRSYFYTAMTEEGIYDYDTTGFSSYLSQDVYNFEFTLPKGFQSAAFDPAPMAAVNDFLQNKAEKFIFIYGALDPWSSTGVNLPANASTKALYKFVNLDGDHATRIATLDEEQQLYISTILKAWVER